MHFWGVRRVLAGMGRCPIYFQVSRCVVQKVFPKSGKSFPDVGKLFSKFKKSLSWFGKPRRDPGKCFCRIAKPPDDTDTWPRPAGLQGNDGT